MHCALEGTVKKLLDLWFNSNNHHYDFYLNSKIKNIDKILLKIQYPSELPRNQRTLVNYNLFKANECRNLIYYCFIYVLKDNMDSEYYEHLINYILFIRILTQDFIDDKDITNSKILITKFVTDFNRLYGTTNLSYNLHCHLHLPDQVKIYGPLNKLSCFAFEGIFKICQYLFFGTNNIAQQIAANLTLKTFINRDCKTNDISNNNLKNFLKDLDKLQNLSENKILFCKYTTLDNLDMIEKNLIQPISLNTVNIPYGTRAIINKIKFSTYCEDAKFKNQDYTVRYLKDKNIKYGLIRRFYQISNTIYAIVQCFSKKKNFVNDPTMEHEF